MIYKYMSGLELTFYHIDVNWLDSYYRAKRKYASVSTVSLDLRNLKAIYNIAKEQDDRLIIKYPFGKGKYQIPEGLASRNIGLSDESGNPTGRKKGSLNRKRIARIYLAYLQVEVNPLTGIKELLSNKDMIALALISKVKKGGINAYKALMDSAYGTVKQSLEVTEAETPIFKQLDINVID